MKMNAKQMLITMSIAIMMMGLGMQPDEDEPGWSCVDDGNRVCGPGNSEGKPAACYDGGGVIVAYWPCEAWTGVNDNQQWKGVR